MLRLEYEPQGLIENIGDAAGFVTRRVEGDLERFKQYIERRGQETGAWRGTINERINAHDTSSASETSSKRSTGPLPHPGLA